MLYAARAGLKGAPKHGTGSVVEARQDCAATHAHTPWHAEHQAPEHWQA